MKQRRCAIGAALFLLAVLFAGSVTFYTAAETQAATTAAKTPKNQFVQKNGIWYYYDNKGKLAKGWFTSKGGTKYYFGKTGAAKAGILTVAGKKYCFNAKGKMLKEWQTVNGKKYFFDQNDGHLHTGWTITPAGNKYYFWKDGVIRPGWQTVSGKQYYFSSQGKMMKNTFAENGKNRYYLNKNGQRVKGRIKIKNAWYAFSRTTAIMVKGGWYKETDGSYYYAGADGKLVSGFYKPDDYYRYSRTSDCKMLTGWQEIGGWNYYFKKKNGLRYDDCKLTLSGKMYYFSKTGKLYEKKWFTKAEGTYYAMNKGVLATGWLTLKGSTYYMNKRTGVRETGWTTVDGEEYYLSPNTGILAKKQWVDDEHYVGEDGALIPGYHEGIFRWPLASGFRTITSYFGPRESPGGVGSTNHGGIDIGAPIGTPIYAAASGTVIAKLLPAQSGGGGNYTLIDHGNGLYTEYMHQSRFAEGLKVDTEVKKGQLIGYVGNTGTVTGAHLHFGVQADGVRRNPLDYVKRP